MKGVLNENKPKVAECLDGDNVNLGTLTYN